MRRCIGKQRGGLVMEGSLTVESYLELFMLWERVGFCSEMKGGNVVVGGRLLYQLESGGVGFVNDLAVHS